MEWEERAESNEKKRRTDEGTKEKTTEDTRREAKRVRKSKTRVSEVGEGCGGRKPKWRKK